MNTSRILSIGAVVLSTAIIAHADVPQKIADAVAKYDGVRNDKTPFGVTDGNPLAATAFMASSAYENFGLRPLLSAAPKTDENNWGFGFSAGGGGFDAGGFDGYYGTADLELGTRFNDSVGLTLLLPLLYRDTEHTSTYIGGLEIGLPIVVMPYKGDDSLSWVLTPSLTGAGAGISKQLAQGGYFFGGGLTSNLSWHKGQLTLLMANQITYDRGRPLAYNSDFNLRQDITQTILKNGFGAIYSFNDKLALDGSVSYTGFLEKAYIDQYWSGDIGLTYFFSPTDGIRVAGKGDYADNYKTYGGELQLFFNW